MGSFKHPKAYDKATMGNLRDAFYEILEETDHLVSFGVSPQRLKADIVARLLVLATDGTPQNQWKSKVLSNLSRR